jgi:hypothetical protein
MSTARLVGAAVPVLFLLILVVGVVWWRRQSRCN